MLRNTTNNHEVNLSRKGFEYPIIDAERTLPTKEVTLELHWEHMPVVGPILMLKL